jgi:hypothetical protein
MFAVIGSAAIVIRIHTVTHVKTFEVVGDLATSEGDVFISENNNGEIGVTDKVHMYVYNYKNPTTPPLQQSSVLAVPPAGQFNVPFDKPGYISYQNGRLFVVDLDTQNWYLSGINAATQWSPTDVNNQAYGGTFETKPDSIQAVVPIPGAGNNIAIFGNVGMEVWQQVNSALFPYQRSSTTNIDYGCLNASSIAALDKYIVWLSANEQGGATVMVFDGGQAKSISTDGIDFILSNISNPSDCTGFLFRQDGHLIYQFTFTSDNLSLIYDFNTQMFFYVSDENQNHHIARNVVFFQNDYYFVSLNDGNVYTFGTQFTNLQYSATDIQMMPRLRICAPIRLPSQRMFIVRSLGFTIENGEPNAVVSPTEAIDISISRDGAASFGNSLRQRMNPTGDRRSRLIFQRLGQANDFSVQIQFIGFGRFIAFDGVVELYL